MQPHQRKHRPFKVALAILIATLGSGSARAHQTYLIADLYELRPGTDN